MTEVVPPARPMLTAKQLVPPARAGAVQRERLGRLLRGNHATRLTVVVAPAGWGKTTLLSHWAHDPAEPRPIAWLSLDEGDDEPVRFWTYLTGALRTIAPDLGSAAMAALGVPGLDPIDVALPTLLNELAASDAQLVLVLDDYHVLEDPRVHEGVEFLLSYLPPSLRLVTTGRFDPPLPLARLRARNDLTEIRTDDLRFTGDEAEAFLAAVGTSVLDAEALGGLVTRTEGWAAGLQLAAVTIRDAPDPAAQAAAIRGDDRHVLDYFASEVLARLAADQRELLVRASVLDRLCGPLCDAVLGRAGSAAVLEQLDRANLFVVPLDQHREWYRCHRLFRDALRRELDETAPEQAPLLLSRAAQWFRARGQPDDAIRHLLAAGEGAAAGALLRDEVVWFVQRGAIATYLQLGERVPAATAHADPRLCVSLAWAARMSAHHDRVLPWLQAGEALIDDDSPPLDGWLSLRAAAATLRATDTFALHGDVATALADAERAVALETDQAMRGYAVARIALGSVLQGALRFEESVTVLGNVWPSPACRELPAILRLPAAGLLAGGQLRLGRADQARRLCAEVAPEAAAIERAWGDAAAPAVGILRFIEGLLALAAGELGNALPLLRRAADLARIWGQPTQVVAVLTNLAEAELAGGDRVASRAALTEAREAADAEVVLPVALDQLQAVEARIGRIAAASARRTGVLVEQLTDRELSILRALQGSASQREIGGELYLSLNTVKGYTKSLYRKLGVVGRSDAVHHARALGLI